MCFCKILNKNHTRTNHTKENQVSRSWEHIKTTNLLRCSRPRILLPHKPKTTVVACGNHVILNYKINPDLKYVLLNGLYFIWMLGLLYIYCRPLQSWKQFFKSHPSPEAKLFLALTFSPTDTSQEGQAVQRQCKLQGITHLWHDCMGTSMK